MLHHTRLGAVLALALAAAVPAHALQFDWDGELAFDNEVRQVELRLDTALERVGLWTDSFQNSINFDPIIALWGSAGDGVFRLMAQNDDCACLKPEQTYFDSGIRLDRLDAGEYRITIARFPNFASSGLLSDGFQDEHNEPVPLETGRAWRLHLADGVEIVDPPPIPEPTSALLMLVGLGGLGMLAQRRRRQGGAEGADQIAPTLPVTGSTIPVM